MKDWAIYQKVMANINSGILTLLNLRSTESRNYYEKNKLIFLYVIIYESRSSKVTSYIIKVESLKDECLKIEELLNKTYN